MENGIYENIILDVGKMKNTVSIYCRRGETSGRTISTMIKNHGKPVNLDDVIFAEMQIKKPDGTYVRDAMIRQDDTLRYKIRTGDTAAAGQAICEIEMTFRDGAKMTTPAFIIEIAEKAIPEGVIESTDRFDSMSQMVADMEQQVSRAERHALDAKAYSEAAKEEVDSISDSRVDEMNAIYEATKQSVAGIKSQYDELSEEIEQAKTETGMKFGYAELEGDDIIFYESESKLTEIARIKKVPEYVHDAVEFVEGLNDLLAKKTEKRKIAFNGSTFSENGTTINFKQLYDAHLTSPDFAFVEYGSRAYLLSYVQDGSGMKELRFQSVIAVTDSNNLSNVKTSGIYVTSSDGVNITSVKVSDVNSENKSYKAAEFTTSNKNSDIWYPSNKAVTGLVEPIQAELAAQKEELEDIKGNGYIYDIEWRYMARADYAPLGWSTGYYGADGTRYANEKYVRTRQRFMLPFKSELSLTPPEGKRGSIVEFFDSEFVGRTDWKTGTTTVTTIPNHRYYFQITDITNASTLINDASFVDSIKAEYRTKEQERKQIKILGIGNSHIKNIMEFVNDILYEAGWDSLAGHTKFDATDLAQQYQSLDPSSEYYGQQEYRYSKYRSICNMGNMPLSEILQREEWDVILLQQQTDKNGQMDWWTGNGLDIVDFANKIRTLCPTAKLGIVSPFAHAKSKSDSTWFNEFYGGSQEAEIKASDEVAPLVAEMIGADYYIPLTEIYQLARSEKALDYGDELTRDGTHPCYGLGQYIECFAVAHHVCGVMSSDITWYPEDTGEYSPWVALNGYTALLCRQIAEITHADSHLKEDLRQKIDDAESRLSESMTEISEDTTEEITDYEDNDAYINVGGKMYYPTSNRKTLAFPISQNDHYTVSKEIGIKLVIGLSENYNPQRNTDLIRVIDASASNNVDVVVQEQNARYFYVYYYDGNSAAETYTATEILSTLTIQKVGGLTAKDTKAREMSLKSSEEIANARIGVDGTVYDNLGDAIREQVSKIDFKSTRFYKKDAIFPVGSELTWFDGDGNYDAFSTNTKVSDYYTAINSLADSWYRMTKYNLGKDASGQYDIYGYRIMPWDLPQLSDGQKHRPRIIITSCHHGFEKGSAFALYHFAKHMKDGKLNDLFNYFEWYFIPIVNPWGFDAYYEVATDAETVGRENSNGVDCNRNYDSGYNNLQPEQKIVYDFIDMYKDNAVLMIDFHNNGSTRNNPSIGAKDWISLTTSTSKQTGLLDMAFAWSEYFALNITKTYWRESWGQNLQLCTSVTSSDGVGLSKWLGEYFNIPSFTLEGTHKCYNDIEEHEYEPSVNKYNTLTLVNVLKLAMKFYADKYI